MAASVSATPARGMSVSDRPLAGSIRVTLPASPESGPV